VPLSDIEQNLAVQHASTPSPPRAADDAIVDSAVVHTNGDALAASASLTGGAARETAPRSSSVTGRALRDPSGLASTSWARLRRRPSTVSRGRPSRPPPRPPPPRSSLRPSRSTSPTA